MDVAQQVEVLDLRHFSGKQLRPLLEAESRVWEERLRWNYRSATELLLDYLDSRVLPGFVATDRGRICGFAFCVYEGQKAVIGDVYSVGEGGRPAEEISRLLLKHLLELVDHSPTVRRVESQLLLYEAGTLSGVFLEAGFQVFPRLFLECELDGPAAAAAGEEFSAGLELGRWAGSDYQVAAELIHRSYAGHIDALINDQYRSLAGSLRFLHNIVRFPGCGVFEAQHSWVLREAATGRLGGLVLCSRIAEDVAHVTQLCVAPAFRGRRLGEKLLRHAMQQLRRAGYAAVTLTVTEENRRAVALYEDLGFGVRHRFDSMYLEKDAAFRA